MMCNINTKRLLLRPFQRRDFEDVFEYSQKAEVARSAGWKPHETKRDSKAAVRAFIESRSIWAIVLEETGKVIGSIGFYHDDKRKGVRAKMIGYALSHDYWGQGITTEAARAVIDHAFNTGKLDILSVYHYPENARSKRVIEKCGFKYEGTLRNAEMLYDGSITDHVCYSLTHEEYKSQHCC